VSAAQDPGKGGAGHSRQEGGAEGPGQAGRQVASHLRVPPLWTYGLRSLAEEGFVHAEVRPCARDRVPRRDPRAFHGPHLRERAFVFYDGTTPLSSTDYLLCALLRESSSFSSFPAGDRVCRQVSGVKSSEGEAGTKIFAPGYLGANAVSSLSLMPETFQCWLLHNRFLILYCTLCYCIFPAQKLVCLLDFFVIALSLSMTLG
jgi:hypothetical protein